MGWFHIHLKSFIKIRLFILLLFDEDHLILFLLVLQLCDLCPRFVITVPPPPPAFILHPAVPAGKSEK